MSRFGGNNRTEKKQNVIDRLKAFFDKYFGLLSGEEIYKTEQTEEDSNLMAAEPKK